MKKISKINIKNILIYLITYIVIFVWSYKTPYLDDDLVFKNRNLGQIVHDGIYDYFNSNGRFFGQSFTRLILSVNPLFSSLCSAFLFVILIWLILHISQVNKKTIKDTNSIHLIFLIMAFVLLVPDFSSPIIWRSGVGNYLATTVVDMLFIWLFLNKKFNNNFYIILTCLTGFIAGWGNENTSGGIILFSLSVIIYNLLKTNKVKVKEVLGTAFMILGYLILIFSPGDHKRMEANDSEFLKMGIITRTIMNFKKMFNYFISEPYNIVFLLLVLNIVVIAFFFWRTNHNYLIGNLLIICGLCSALVLILSPEGMDTGRTYFGPYTLMFMGSVMLVPSEFHNSYSRCIYTCVYVTTIFLSCIALMNGAIMAKDFNRQLIQRYQYIEQERSHSKQVSLVPIQYKKNKYTLSTSYAEVAKGSKDQFPNNIYYWNYKVKVVPTTTDR